MVFCTQFGFASDIHFHEVKAKALSEQDLVFSLDEIPEHLLSELESGSNTLSLDFSNNLSFNLELRQYSLIADNFQLRTASTDGITDYPLSTAQTFRGKVVNDPESHVCLTIGSDYLAGRIVTGSGEQYFLETNTTTIKASGVECGLRIYQVNADDETYINLENDIGIADLTELMSITQPVSNTTYSRDVLYEAEIALVADYYAYSKAGSVALIADELLNILNITDAYYNQVNLTYQLVEMFVFTTPDMEPWPDSNDAGVLLDAFDSWVGNGGLLNWHDLATFWTGRPVGYSYAWLNSIGTYRRHHLVEFWDTGYSRWLGNFQTHESGHNWGAVHVAEDPRWIMSPLIYDGVIDWNASTTAAFPGFINAAIDYLVPADSVTTPVYLSYQPQVINDDNQNGGSDPGENFELHLSVVNVGDAPGNNVVVELSVSGTNSNYISVHTSADTIPLLTPMITDFSQHQLSVADDIPIPSLINLNYLISDGTVEAAATYQLEVGQVPVYGFSVGGVNDNGNGNSKFDPGEQIELLMEVSNLGEVTGHNISITLQPQGINGSFIQNLTSPQTIIDMDAETTIQVSFNFDIAANFPVGGELDLMIAVSDSFSHNLRLRSFTVGNPSGHYLWEDFEYYGTGPIGNGWAVQQSSGLTTVTTPDSIEVHDEDNGNWNSDPWRGHRALYSGENWSGSGPGEVRIITPIIDLQNATEPLLNFYEIRGWDNYWPNLKQQHQIIIEVATDSSGPWITLETIDYSENNFMTWQSVNEIDLSGYVGQQVFLSFFTDTHHYYWRLDNVSVAESGYSSNHEEPIPLTFSLSQNYPNPFNSATTIEYSLVYPARVLLAVYDITGRQISELVNGIRAANNYRIHWDGQNNDGLPAGAGVYFCRIQIGNTERTIKMLLLK
ncbi:MAG: T9SS type A sorting domain-containing protein [Candidatus Marinimicrobia bacterium]|nr:T9SS type A sorting domain-containing protein [Candidatus Neomarinimicrobiota bacterium]